MGIQIVTISETRTAHFLGQCRTCIRPLRITLTEQAGNTVTRDCTQCGQPFDLQRLATTVNADYCDGACMAAVGPNCSCSCDGDNHGAAWQGGPRRYSEEKKLYDDPEPTPAYTAALAKHRTKTERTRERNEQRRAAREAAHAAEAQAAYTAWTEGLTAEQRRVADFIRNGRNVENESDFLWSMGRELRAGQFLTGPQLAATVQWVTGMWDRMDSDAREALTAQPVPTGRVEITAQVVSTRADDNRYARGTVYKMLVKDGGWKVWMRIPESLFRAVDYRMDDLRGRRVQMTVTIKASDDDPSFGFGSRPTGAALLP